MHATNASTKLQPQPGPTGKTKTRKQKSNAPKKQYHTIRSQGKQTVRRPMMHALTKNGKDHVSMYVCMYVCVVSKMTMTMRKGPPKKKRGGNVRRETSMKKTDGRKVRRYATLLPNKIGKPSPANVPPRDATSSRSSTNKQRSKPSRYVSCRRNKRSVNRQLGRLASKQISKSPAKQAFVP